MRIQGRSIRSKFALVFLLGAGAILFVHVLDQMQDLRRAKIACLGSQRAIARIVAGAIARRVESIQVPLSQSQTPISRNAASVISDIRTDHTGELVFDVMTSHMSANAKINKQVAVIPVDSLSDIIPTPAAHDQWSLCGLVSRSGKLVASAKGSLAHSRRSSDLSRIKFRINPTRGYPLNCSIGGTEAIGAVEVVPRTGWQVVVLQQADLALKPARQAWKWVLDSALVALIALAGAFAMSNRLVHSIRRLVHVASAMAVGDYRKRIRVESGDELGHLAESFNALGESLVNHEAQLKAQTEMLAGMIEAARVASSSLDLGECGKAIANVVCTHLGAQDATVFLKDRSNGGIELIGHYGKRHKAAWRRLASHSADSGDYLVITESEPDPENPGDKVELQLVGAPLISGAETLGAIVARFGNDLTRDDLKLGSQRADVMTAFAIHAAAAVGNAQVHLRTAEYSEILEGWVEHVSAILQVTDAISTSLDLDEALEALSRATASVMNVDECVIFLQDRGEKLVVRSCFCSEERKKELLQVRLAPGESATGKAFAEKGYVACTDALSCDDTFTRKLCQKSGLRGVLCAPLVVGEEAIGVITLYCFTPREFSQNEIQLLMSIGLHAAVVIRNASLYTREASIAETLQKGLMSEAPEQCRGLKLAGRYIPALDEARVGGDFYDVTPLPNGKVAVVIGDVSGKGLKAAIHLATCKYMFKALVYAHPDEPDIVLGELNEAINYYFQQSFFVTTFCAIIDPPTRTISYANAGHPPAFLITEKANMHTCLSSTGTPVGSGQHCNYEKGRAVAKPGDVLLLYTDGVTDAIRDGERLEIEGLHKLVFKLGLCPAHRLVDRLFTQICDGSNSSRKDDIALLAVSFEGQPAASKALGGGQSGEKCYVTARTA